MMRRKRTAAAGGLAILIGVIALLTQPAAAWAAGTTYYVDTASGSDSSAGTSPASAWASLEKVNATTFSAGDQILFHGDQSWSGRLHPLGSGAVDSPITISSYDGGARPIIDGASLAGSGTVYLKNQSYWTIRGLEVVSDSGTDNLDHGQSRSGIMVDNNNGGTLKGITIQDNYVHDVNGCFRCNDINAHNNGGIAVVADIYTVISWQGDKYDGVQILDNRVENVGRSGIVFDDNSSGTGPLVTTSALSKNVTISGNTVLNSDSDGITMAGVNSGKIDHNVVGGAGQKTIASSGQPATAGLWPTKTNNVTIEYNEVYGTQTHTTDGQGFDIDIAASNTVVQYNYSHDNQGGFLLLENGLVDGANATVRYNLSVNDDYDGLKGVFEFALGVKKNTSIYNNTVYVAPGLPSNILGCNSCDVSATWDFRDNIIANFGTGGYAYPTKSATFDSNVFFGNHPASEPADPNKLTSDPGFVSPTGAAPYGIDSVAGFQVTPSSAATGSGTLVTANGGQDYFGRPVSATEKPTRGFYEATDY